MKAITSDKQLAVYIENPPVGEKIGNVGEALRAALAKRQEKEREQDEYELHELACNIAEDLDGGAIFAWRLDEVKEHLRAGGTTAIDDEGELVLVNYNVDLCPGCAAAERDGISTTCGGRC